MSALRAQTTALLALADQCVKCGYCLPACPTFRLYATEAESPRGRIALIQGWLDGDLAASPVLFGHLDQCLECRACEAVCPSLVRFGHLMDGARAIRQQHRAWWGRWPRQAKLALLSRPRWLGWLLPLTRLLIRLTVVIPWPGLDIPRRLSTVLHRPRVPDAAPSPPATPPVGLFLGCVARLTQGSTIDAARRLLTQLGIAWEEPPDQGCCGAMHQHQGFPHTANQYLENNRHAFRRHEVVIGFASACVLELQRCEALHAQEICDFLVRSKALAQAQVRPLPARVLVHEPCSQRVLPGGSAAIYHLLRQIPQLDIQPLPGNDHCCGAAGSYLLEHPRIALALLEPKIAALRAAQADYLVTTNSGCALHLAAGVQAAGLTTQVLHPIELLESQLCAPDSPEPIAISQDNTL